MGCNQAKQRKLRQDYPEVIQIKVLEGGQLQATPGKHFHDCSTTHFSKNEHQQMHHHCHIYNALQISSPSPKKQYCQESENLDEDDLQEQNQINYEIGNYNQNTKYNKNYLNSLENNKKNCKITDLQNITQLTSDSSDLCREYFYLPEKNQRCMQKFKRTYSDDHENNDLFPQYISLQSAKNQNKIVIQLKKSDLLNRRKQQLQQQRNNHKI